MDERRNKRIRKDALKVSPSPEQSSTASSECDVKLEDYDVRVDEYADGVARSDVRLDTYSTLKDIRDSLSEIVAASRLSDASCASTGSSCSIIIENECRKEVDGSITVELNNKFVKRRKGDMKQIHLDPKVDTFNSKHEHFRSEQARQISSTHHIKQREAFEMKMVHKAKKERWGELTKQIREQVENARSNAKTTSSQHSTNRSQTIITSSSITPSPNVNQNQIKSAPERITTVSETVSERTEPSNVNKNSDGALSLRECDILLV